MDVLSEILSRVRISGSVLAELRCGGAWGIDMLTGETVGIRNGIPFHYMLEGKCLLLDGKGATPVNPGDLIAAPRWQFHALTCAPDQPLLGIAEVIENNGLPEWRGGTLDRPLIIRAGDEPCTVRILSGVFTLEGGGVAGLIEQLPALLHLRAQIDGLGPQMGTALHFIREESAAKRPGYVAVAARMMDLLFIQILRAAMSEPSVQIGLLAGLADPNLARAIAVIHSDPARRRTVAELASEACLSRTVFAERFRALVGLTPIQYVNRWRMTVAEDLLSRSETSIDAIRNHLGFSSSFAFARTFRAHCGLSPREYRRAIKQAPTDQPY